ncbi:MAG TPA: diguanylate cyclase [Gemmatimonadales bacterium]|nr:diguanylate cyclase [Gemmatimonadales bacterium]
MRTRPTILFFSPDGRPVPPLVRRWAEANAYPLQPLADPGAVESIVLRGHPAVLVFDAAGDGTAGQAMLRRLKSDSFTAIVPALAIGAAADSASVQQWFAAGADEVLTSGFSADEQQARMEAMLSRTERDVAVHPSTRLPGTTEIEREIRRRLEAGGDFAVCYADLDHFKEFNDRYSYYDGDRVIYILSRILHDVVKGMLGGQGFVGHIGGDDFIFVIPAADMSPVCSEILHIFDSLIPLQYSEQDRRAGYFFGKDRRGQLHRVPLMTLSIGIVTNRTRRFTHPAQVSELATEMKSYAKTLPGSVFVVDRRHGGDGEGPGGQQSRHSRESK